MDIWIIRNVKTREIVSIYQGRNAAMMDTARLKGLGYNVELSHNWAYPIGARLPIVLCAVADAASGD